MIDFDLNILALIIDTNKYAGNFERDMTAYCTGQVGYDDNTGYKLAILFDKDYPGKRDDSTWDDYFEQFPDDHGCCRPTSVFRSPGSTENNSVAIFLNNNITEEAIELVKQRALIFNKVKSEYRYDKYSDIKVLGFRLVRITTSITPLWTEQFDD